MKILICLLGIFIFMGFGSAFCQGWEAGYIAGYCYGQSYCANPYVPFCPYPKWNEKTYQDGYNRGFLAGMNAKR